MISQEDRRARYFQVLRLPDTPTGAAQKVALTRAHDLRKFEIENYWRRATYFWGFQLVAFGALALTAKDGHVYPPLVMVVALLGTVTSKAAILTARGSKFWQRNWEAHVDLLEDELEGRLHKVVSVRDDGLQPSVSDTNEKLLCAFYYGWIGLFLAAVSTLMFPALISLDPFTAAILQVLICSVILLTGIWWIGSSRLSQLDDRSYRHADFEKL